MTVMTDAARRQLVRDYLRDTGWSATRLAQACRLNQATITRFLSEDADQRRDLGLETALRLQRGTRSAYKAGETRVKPLRAADLLQADLAELLPTG